MDKDLLRRQLVDEIQAEFDSKLRQAKRQKEQAEVELEAASERWRAEKRRLNSEIDRLEAALVDAKAAAARKKVEPEHVTQALAGLGQQARYNQLRQQVMDLADCSRRTAQLAIAEACRQGSIVQADGKYRWPF